MAQRGVEVQFNSWTQITQTVDQPFLAQNKTLGELYVIFDTAAPVSPAIQTDIDRAMPVEPEKPFERPDNAPLGTHCYVKMSNQSVDRNSRDFVAIMSP